MSIFNFRTDLDLKEAVDKKVQRQGEVGTVLTLGFQEYVAGTLVVPEDGAGEATMKEQMFVRGIREVAHVQAKARARLEGVSLSHVARHILTLWVEDRWSMKLVRNET